MSMMELKPIKYFSAMGRGWGGETKLFSRDVDMYKVADEVSQVRAQLASMQTVFK